MTLDKWGQRIAPPSTHPGGFFSSGLVLAVALVCLIEITSLLHILLLIMSHSRVVIAVFMAQLGKTTG